jgi:hypothetical protein
VLSVVFEDVVPVLEGTTAVLVGAVTIVFKVIVFWKVLCLVLEGVVCCFGRCCACIGWYCGCFGRCCDYCFKVIVFWKVLCLVLEGVVCCFGRCCVCFGRCILFLKVLSVF